MQIHKGKGAVWLFTSLFLWGVIFRELRGLPVFGNLDAFLRGPVVVHVVAHASYFSLILRHTIARGQYRGIFRVSFPTKIQSSLRLSS